MRQRLEAAAPEDFQDVKKRCLRYVSDWPDALVTETRVMILQVEDDRAEELGKTREPAVHRGAEAQQFMGLFQRDWGGISEDLRETCQHEFQSGRNDFTRISRQ